MTEDSNIRTLLIEKGVDVPHEKFLQTWSYIVKEGRSCLGKTGLVLDRNLSGEDVKNLKIFYSRVNNFQEDLLGVDGAVFNRSLREHLLLTERVAIKFAEVLGLDENLIDVEALIHDFGRMVSHRRGVNDDFAKDMAMDIGIKGSLMDLLPPDSMWEDNNEDSVRKNVNKMCEENNGISAVLLLADVLGKWKNSKNGELRKWEDVVPLTNARQRLPDGENMWPIELHRQQIITSGEGKNYVGIKYEMIKDWFEAKSGMKINDFVTMVEKSLQNEPIKNSWI